MTEVARAALLSALLFLPATYADEAHQNPAAGTASQAADALAEGEVRRVDKDAKKITIKHGPLPELDMPAMTMVFQVKDPAMLDRVKTGDRIRFQAEKRGGAFTITMIETR